MILNDSNAQRELITAIRGRPPTDVVLLFPVPPYIEQPMQSKKSSKKGETTVLQCMASGSPQPKLTWLKDDKELVVSQRLFNCAF